MQFTLLLLAACVLVLGSAAPLEPIPDKTVVLTFDDAVKSHITNVAPILLDHGFGATFFITALWMPDTENFLSWDDVAQLHQMGFEIGNHTWSHTGMGTPRFAARLAGQLALLESALKEVDVPKPVSFGWPGNAFSSEALAVLRANGYQFARRGMQPEIPYGKIAPGPLYDPAAHDPLLIPSAGDAYPEWTLDDFKRVVDRAGDGRIAIVQFHGVPDVAHPWVHTPPERFREYMAYLKDNGFNVIAMRDLARYVDPATPPKDAMVSVRYTSGAMDPAPEVAATRQDLPFWLSNMIRYHGYTLEEAAPVCGYWSAKDLESDIAKLTLDLSPAPPPDPAAPVKVLPYPGGRHPRIGFLEGAISPMRGTKITVFTPWPEGGYVVVDLPEAIFCNLGLLYLAHTHVPTIWNQEHVAIENVDWKPAAAGGWENTWSLPNGARFGATVTPGVGRADFSLWLENGTPEALTELRTQVCAMLKDAPGFNAQSETGRRLEDGVAAMQSANGDRWVLIAFDRHKRTWGNPRVPCIHSDPVLPDAAPGQRVEVKGRLWFYEGADVEAEIARAKADFAAQS
jgi:peptidoglycan/xylan/chitin deacetylase (PgdA/CDA1 family)